MLLYVELWATRIHRIHRVTVDVCLVNIMVKRFVRESILSPSTVRGVLTVVLRLYELYFSKRQLFFPTTPYAHSSSMPLLRRPLGPALRDVTIRINPSSPHQLPHEFRTCQYSLLSASTPHPVTEMTWSRSSRVALWLSGRP